MYNLRQLRSDVQLCEQAAGGDLRRGRQLFLNVFMEGMGLRKRQADDTFTESVDEFGRKKLTENRVRPREVSIKEMADAIGGRQLLQFFEEGPDAMGLLEAGPGLDPTLMININTFNAATGGLIEAQILDSFANHPQIGDSLVTIRPTRKNGEKMIGATGIHKDDSEMERRINEPHARTTIGEAWIETPELVERALAIDVTQEIVLHDLTGQVLDRAQGVGEALAYGRERTILRLVAGLTNPYVYKGVGYNTYQASTPWINSHANPAATIADIDQALELFTNMTDPETGREIVVEPTTIIHDPSVRTLWHSLLNSTEVRHVSGSETRLFTPPPSAASNYSTLDSTILRNLLIESGVSAENAKQYWFFGAPQRAFMWMEAWPLRVQQAPATSYIMLDRGLIASYFANYRGVGAVKEPRYMTRNTN